MKNQRKSVEGQKRILENYQKLIKLAQMHLENLERLCNVFGNRLNPFQCEELCIRSQDNIGTYAKWFSNSDEIMRNASQVP